MAKARRYLARLIPDHPTGSMGDMAVPKVEFTPVSAPRGRLVHAVSLTSPVKTACGRKFKGWIIALKPLSCRDCKLALLHDCRPKK